MDCLHAALLAEGYDVTLSYNQLMYWYELVREANYDLTATVLRDAGGWRLAALEAGKSAVPLYALAVDLGSTTVSMRLLNVESGDILAERTHRNAQRRYGDDILSRIFYTTYDPARRRELQEVTVGTLNRLAEEVCAAGGITPGQCCAMALAGNTAMIHFLLGLDTFCLFHTPFLPRIRRVGWIECAELGLVCGGYLYCFPATANYLGGDIISGLLSTGMTKRDEISLFVDIGTNGEMIIGNRHFLVGGAGAAGPALEAGISKSGMRARDGAVDSVRIEDGTLHFTTIGGDRARGICGSGIVDLLAEMLLAGWMDGKGYLNEAASERIRRIDGERVVVYADEGESESGEALYFSETDIRQFTDTKAAAHTMVELLLQSSGVPLENVDHIYLAGAFGRHMDLESTITIGMYPDAPREKFIQVGNSSLQGATDLLLGRFTAEEANKVAEEIFYLEFAMEENFLSLMQAACFYPYTDLAQYPSVAEKLKRLQP
ncbi:MAG: DUF4445 domain-containing protein [Oscillospiraceae bacterium]|nr:DUF4445 domain-containing protein [Oscillospiraceae bacterium]